MRCRFLFHFFSFDVMGKMFPLAFSDTLLYSERGVKKAPELLPEYYTGRDEDQGSIGL